MAKLNHFWNCQTGRFWYLNVSKAPGEKNIVFRDGPKWLVGSSLTESLMEWVSKNTLEHPQAALASQNITHIKWNTPPDTKKHKRYNQTPTDNAKCLQTFSSPLKHAWLSQIGANPQFWQNGERQEFQTSKHQNLPIYHFQKSLSLAIFLIFHVCQREITIYSLFGSPCIARYICHICDISQLWSYAPGFTQSICQKIFQTVSHATYKTYPLLSNYSTCLSRNVNFVFELGNAFIGTLVWDSNDGHTGILSQNPNISNFPNQIKTTKQGRKSYSLPMLLLSLKNLV